MIIVQLRKKADCYGGNLCEGQFFFKELRLPGVNLPLLCGHVGGVKSCHGDMSAVLHQRAGFPVTSGSAFAPTAAVSQTQLPRLPSAPSEPGLGRGVYCGDMGVALRAWGWGAGRKMGFLAINCDIFADL